MLSDWGINFNELEIGKKIGDGRTGEVCVMGVQFSYHDNNLGIMTINWAS